VPVRFNPPLQQTFRLGLTATPGNVLTADANGVGTWQPLPASGGSVGGPLPTDYPKVATIYSKADENDLPGRLAIAKFMLYVTDFNWWPETSSTNLPAGWTVGEAIKSVQHAGAKNIIYWHSCLLEKANGFYQTEPGSDYWHHTDATGYYVNGTRYRMPHEWLACNVGSTLTGAIDNSTGSVPVADLTNFAVGDHVLIGGILGQVAELTKVIAKSAGSGAGTLTVTRGLNPQNTAYIGGSIVSVGGGYPAVAHASGVAARTVSYAFGSPDYMILNITSRCQLADGGFGPQTYNQWQASFLKLKLGEPHFTNLDGVFLDNFLPFSTAIWSNWSAGDGLNNNTNTPYSNSDWVVGMQDNGTRMRTALGSSAIILGNVGGAAADFNGALNGGMIEGLGEDGTNGLANFVDGSAFQFYHNWDTAFGGASYFIMNGTSGDSPASAIQTNYRVMRFQLGWTLLANGYFCYDGFGYSGLNGGSHDTEWWYDEYDNVGAGLGYLGQPLEAYQTYSAGVYTRKFAKGIVVVNTTGSTVSSIALGGTYKRINGVQDHTANDGATGITTQTLIAHDARILIV
jgi:hypothetical protein